MKGALFQVGRFMVGLVLLFAAACGDGERDRLERNLASKEAELAQSRAEVLELSAQNRMLQSDYRDLETYCENLRVEKKELTEWSRSVASRFGPGVWYIGPYEKPLPHKPIEKATAPDLVRELNRLLRRDHLPEVILINIENYTARVKVSDETQLTQQMGSAGAEAYLNAVTFTLCSLDAIQCVQFDFKAGDHAVPGKLCP
jgi:hypothetical protein